MRLRAAHHPYVTRNGDRLQAEPREDARVGVVVEAVRVVEPRFVAIG